MVDRRSEILSGNLSFPEQIFKIVNPNDGEKDAILNFWDNISITSISFTAIKPTIIQRVGKIYALSMLT